MNFAFHSKIYIAMGYISFMVTNYQFDKSSHAVFSMQFHLIIVVKYRQKAFVNDKIINRIKQLTKEIADDFDCEIINQETDLDHIHILFKATPKIEITKFINSLKGVTSRILRKEFSKELKNILWGESFWSDSYCLITTGQTTLDQLKKYVENQGK
jgi:putative transposase